MNLRVVKTAALAVASIASCNTYLMAQAAASPTAVTFNFDNMGGATYNASGQDASSYQISNYMTNELQKIAKFSTKTITVDGAIGEQGAKSYVGDNFVVGPTIGPQGNKKVYPLTLANTNGLVNPKDTSKWDGAANSTSNPPVLTDTNIDGFLKNCTNIIGIDPKALGATSTKGCYDNPNVAGDQGSPDIFIDFHGLKIVSFSFDFQIFPDGTCTALDGNGSACGGAGDPNIPDLEIWSGNNGTGVHFGTFTGVTPGGHPPITCDSNGATDSTYAKSGGGVVNSGVNSQVPVTETAPQLICTATYTVSAFTSNNITTLDFMDWPETIGIDNLKVYLPEPSSIPMFAIGLVGLVIFGRRKGASLARLLARPRQA
jgi:hypothetical protein